MDNLQLGGLFAFIVIIIGGWYGYEVKIDTLKGTINQLTATLKTSGEDLGSCERNKEELRISLAEVNEATLLLGQDYTNTVEEYEALKKKPKEIRYKFVYKYIDREVDSNECIDIKNTIDDTVDYINSRM